MFKSYIHEDTEVNFKCANSDLTYVSFEGLNMQEEDIKKVTKHIQLNMALIKEIFIYLQGFSTCFPNLDYFNFREHFLKKAELPMSNFDKASYDAILS